MGKDRHAAVPGVVLEIEIQIRHLLLKYRYREKAVQVFTCNIVRIFEKMTIRPIQEQNRPIFPVFLTPIRIARQRDFYFFRVPVIIDLLQRRIRIRKLRRIGRYSVKGHADTLRRRQAQNIQIFKTEDF